MSGDKDGATLAAILDALTLVQDQLEEIGERGKRLEAGQAEILGRLDTIDAAQAGVVDLQPTLEHILAELAAGRQTVMGGLAKVAAVAGFAHAAARGSEAPLPAEVLDDPLLELFVLSQPADRRSTSRALVDWRRVAHERETTELTDILRRQYRPSPTDTAATRRLRYQLAAITREELEGRGATPPPPPEGTTASDRSAAAQESRSAALISAWRIGENAALYADPELAGAMDIVAEARRQGADLSAAELATALAGLHRTIADRLAVGDRPELVAGNASPAPAIDVDRQR